jgi:uncharacterized delta-60 repeat protein
MLATAIAAVVPAAAPAAAATMQLPSGSLDTSFGVGAFDATLIGTSTGGVASAEQSNGDIVSAGAAVVGGTSEMLVTRLLPNGTADQSFGTNGAVLVPIGKSAYADAIVLQRNGMIVVAGTGRSPVTGTLSLAAARLTTSGNLDQSFGNGGVALVPVGANAVANAVAIGSGGTILLGGSALTDHNRFVAARLTPGGALDTSYGSGGVTLLGPVGGAWGMTLQPNGDVVLGGQETYNGTQAFMLARLLANGAPDTSFGQQGVVTVPIGSTAAGMAVALQSNGDILMTGNATAGTRVIATVRLLPNGSLDPSFGSSGIATFAGSGVNTMALESDGEILLGGAGPSVSLLTTSGTLDPAFGRQGIAFAIIGTNGSANGVTVQSDGKIVLTGATNLAGHVVMVVARVNP